MARELVSLYSDHDVAGLIATLYRFHCIGHLDTVSTPLVYSVWNGSRVVRAVYRNFARGGGNLGYGKREGGGGRYRGHGAVNPCCGMEVPQYKVSAALSKS